MKKELIKKLESQQSELLHAGNLNSSLILSELKKDVSKFRITFNEDFLNKATLVLNDIENAKGNNLDHVAMNSFLKNYKNESLGAFTKSLQDAKAQIISKITDKEIEIQQSGIDFPENLLSTEYHINTLTNELSNQTNSLNSQNDIDSFLNEYVQEMFKYDFQNQIQGENRDSLLIQYTEKQRENRKKSVDLFLNHKEFNSLHSIKKGINGYKEKKMSLEENGVHIHREHGFNNKKKPPFLNLSDNSNGTGTVVLLHCLTTESQVQKALNKTIQPNQIEYPNLLFFKEERTSNKLMVQKNGEKGIYLYATGRFEDERVPSGTRLTNSKNRELDGADIAISPSKQVIYIGPESEKAFDENRVPDSLKNLPLKIPANFAKMEKPLINIPLKISKSKSKKKSTENSNISFNQKFAKAITTPSINIIENNKPFIIPIKQPIEKKLPKRKQFKPT